MIYGLTLAGSLPRRTGLLNNPSRRFYPGGEVGLCLGQATAGEAGLAGP